ARNLVTGTTTLVSMNSAGTGSGNSSSYDPVISADGSVVAFDSYASNLSPLDTNVNRDVFARNVLTGTTQLVSINTTGTGSGNGDSYYPVISADGNVIVFESNSSNLNLLKTTTNSYDLFARNLVTKTTQSVTANSVGNIYAYSAG